MRFNRICNAIGSYNVTLSLRRKVLRKPRNKLLRPLAAIKTNVYKRITNEPYYGKDKDVRNSFFSFQHDYISLFGETFVSLRANKI